VEGGEFEDEELRAKGEERSVESLRMKS